MVRRPMRAAFERGFVETGFRQHGLRQFDMRGLAGMRGAGQRQFAVAEAIGIGRTAFDQWQRLDRLHRRARKHRARRLADFEQRLALGIEHGDRAAMGAFDHRAAQNLDQNRI